jgi:sensor domain CHASE-containing protein
VNQTSYVLLVSRQGKVRLAKWFSTLAAKQKSKIVKDVTQLVLARRTRMCNFLEYKGRYLAKASSASMESTEDACSHGRCADTKVVYRRYASLFFVMGISASDNELVALEVIHRYVELLDKYFGNVSRRDCFACVTGIS